MKGALRLLAGILLAGLLLWWLFRDQDWPSLRKALASASLPLLLTAAFLNLAQLVPRLIRWRQLLAPVSTEIPLRPAAAGMTFGYMTTWIVPGRIGELIRPAYLAARARLPLAPLIGSAVGDRLFDAWALVVLFAIGLALGGGGVGAERFHGAAVVMLAGAVVGLGILVWIASHRESLLRWFSGRHRFLAWVGRLVIDLSRGVSVLRNPRALLSVSLWSLFLWAFLAFSTWLSIRACGIPIGYEQVLAFMPLLALGAAVPTPGNLGGYQAAMAFGLELGYGVDATAALTAGLLSHLTITLPWIFAGILLMKVERLRFRDLLALAGRKESPDASESAS
jgi:uncharacterized membrane protein YbhN (UPF0104 family)